jgi:hypothetical protein
MQKNVLTFGLIAGLLNAAWMIAAGAMGSEGHFENGELIGFSAMILSFSLIFVAVKNFRDKHNNGTVTFGKAFLIGLYISLIASTFYVIAWHIDYRFFIPDFMEKYSAHLIDKMRASGASAEDIEKKTAEMKAMGEQYRNFIYRTLVTYMEILPVGILISLISAAILKRKPATTV